MFVYRGINIYQYLKTWVYTIHNLLSISDIEKRTYISDDIKCRESIFLLLTRLSNLYNEIWYHWYDIHSAFSKKRSNLNDFFRLPLLSLWVSSFLISTLPLEWIVQRSTFWPLFLLSFGLHISYVFFNLCLMTSAKSQLTNIYICVEGINI